MRLHWQVCLQLLSCPSRPSPVRRCLRAAWLRRRVCVPTIRSLSTNWLQSSGLWLLKLLPALYLQPYSTFYPRQPWSSMPPNLMPSLRRRTTSVSLPGRQVLLLPKGLSRLKILASLTRMVWMRFFATYVSLLVLSKAALDEVVDVVAEVFRMWNHSLFLQSPRCGSLRLPLLLSTMMLQAVN